MRGLSFGFTLIELLVVIAIIAGLVIIVAPRFTSFNQTQSLQNAAADFQTSLRVAQSNASSGSKCVNGPPGTPAASWYLKIVDERSYKVESTCSDTSGITPTPVSPAALPVGAVFKEVRLCASPSSPDNFKVKFANISGKVSFESGDSGCPVNSTMNKMTVVLELADQSKSVSVEVEKGGSIYVNSQ